MILSSIYMLALALVISPVSSLSKVPKVQEHLEQPTINNRPIIGVLAQHLHYEDFPIPGDSYVSASYVKYLEMAGARVVPIKINTPEDELVKIFSSINGVLFPGGDSYVLDSPYQRSAEFAFDFAIKEAKNGRDFPIWGTCLGMQQLSVLAAKTDVILSDSKGTWDTAMPLRILTNDSSLLKNMPSKIFNILTTKNVTYNAHYNCVAVESYNENKDLNNFFSVVSTNIDAAGKTFLSTIEARKYPIYATQWHPEMNMFEFTHNEGLGANINHSKDAVLVSQYFSNFFVGEARKNFNKFKREAEEMQYLFYNYKPSYTGKYGLFDEQMYVF